MDKIAKIQKYFCQKDKLDLKNTTYLKHLNLFVLENLKEDLGLTGDITSDFLISGNPKSKAEIVSKEDGIIAGLNEAEWLLKKYQLKVEFLKNDGSQIKAEDKILKITGGIKNILKTERTVLNLIQRMSGIATTTQRLVNKINKQTLICSTRKTNWGLLDKKAVVLGGGGTHRLGLYDFILIKDNHWDFITKSKKQRAISKNIKMKKLKNKFWEIEVKNFKEAEIISEFNPDAIMLDNFKLVELKKTINFFKKNKPKTIIEVSGGINEKNIKNYALSGVDIISLGSLTHSIKALDLSLDIL